MMTLVSILALGFFLGMRHATDPDHLIAVSTIVARYRSVRQALWIGAFWGLGHTVTVLVVGGLVMLMGWTIPHRVGLSLEFSVGLMLILLGALNLASFAQWFRKDSFVTEDSAGVVMLPHTHAHGDYVHTHPHQAAGGRHPHDPEQTPVNWIDRHFGASGMFQALRPLFVGVVHGMAGSSAVALLVLATIRNGQWALLYLLLFGAGTIVGMMLVTVAMAVPFVYAGRRLRNWQRAFRLASGAVSVGFGLFLAYRVGFVNGLF